ncbi:MAG TPA: hypothetical protein VN666_09940 [Nitrospira sp.]|nr:hypothetical protein [Nitrospira sp.]
MERFVSTLWQKPSGGETDARELSVRSHHIVKTQCISNLIKSGDCHENTDEHTGEHGAVGCGSRDGIDLDELRSRRRADELSSCAEHRQGLRGADRVPGGRAQHRLDSKHGRRVQDCFGGQNNGIAPGPIADGRREINWDGGGSTTTVTGTPLINFQAARGALFTTPGTGFVQAPLDGLVTTFGNQTFATIFQPFSLQRLFSPINSNVTEATFFVPGPDNNAKPATTKGFGAVFTDVDLPDGSGLGNKNGNRKASTLIEYFGADGGLLYSSFVAASPGDKSLSFLGIVFTDARIAKVRITSGDAAPGPNDDGTHDIAMMDDFLYGEPQQIR